MTGRIVFLHYNKKKCGALCITSAFYIYREGQNSLFRVLSFFYLQNFLKENENENQRSAKQRLFIINYYVKETFILMRRKRITRLITAVMAVIICVLGIIPTAFAEDSIDLNKINLDKFGDVITNEELGYNISTSGLFTKEQLENIINSPAVFSRVASTTVTLSYCYDTKGKPFENLPEQLPE